MPRRSWPPVIAIATPVMEGSAKRRVETRAEGVSVVGSATSDFLTLIQRAAGAIRKLGPAILFTLGLF